MMEQIVTLSNFIFNGVNYLRVQGAAMDTGMASSCANLFMAELGRRTCSTGHSKREHFNQPDHSTEVLGTEKHTRTITYHAESNRKATGPLN